MPVTDIVQQHYQKIANIYNDLWTHSPEFVGFLTRKIVASLHLQPADILVDIGCGTGIYTQEIFNQIPLEHPIICVDPSDKMLSKIPANLPIQRVCTDAVTFASQPGNYDRILIKDAIHLISDLDRLFSHFFQRLEPGGILLILMFPPKIDRPLFDKAIERYEAGQPDYRDLVKLMEDVGFEVEIDFFEYPLAIEKSQYLYMVESRYMTGLANFGDREIKEGVEEMARRYSDCSVLRFTERFVFLQAVKP